MANVPYQHLGSALATDYFFVREQFSDEQWDHFLRTRRFVDDEVLPAINEYWERAELPWPLMRRLVDLDLYGEDIAGYGCPGMSPLARGLVNMELHRGDGSLGTFLGVQSGLAMKSIDLLGSEAQKERWLPAMARLETIGAFALTEPAHGSDSVALETSARREGDTGCSTAPSAGSGTARSPTWWSSSRAPTRTARSKRSWSRRTRPASRPSRSAARGLRARSGRPTITLDGVRVPEASRLPGAETFKDAGRVLVTTRSVCAWGALGHAVAAYDAALTYSKQRTQFGKPLAGFQIVQERLVRMLAAVTSMQLYCMQLARLEEERAPVGHDRRPRQVPQHPHGARGHRARAGHARRQRRPAREPRYPPHGRHRGHPHLRGHRDHAGADRGPRHHGLGRVHVKR